MGNNSGKVISTTIDKYCYISLRQLPPFLSINIELGTLKEEVRKISQIKYNSVRECLKYFKYRNSIEAIHFADLPAQSGLGASSSFTVGLQIVLRVTRKKNIKKSLYRSNQY